MWKVLGLVLAISTPAYPQEARILPPGPSQTFIPGTSIILPPPYTPPPQMAPGGEAPIEESHTWKQDQERYYKTHPLQEKVDKYSRQCMEETNKVNEKADAATYTYEFFQNLPGCAEARELSKQLTINVPPLPASAFKHTPKPGEGWGR